MSNFLSVALACALCVCSSVSGKVQADWVEAKVVAVAYSQAAPAGAAPGQSKGVEYRLLLPDGNEVIAYDIAKTVFSNFPKERAAKGDTVKVRLKGKRISLRTANGAERKLFVGQTSKRPAR